MEEFWLRWIVTALAGAALAVLFCRQVAHWTDKDPWLIRSTAYVTIVLGVIGMAVFLDVGIALKVLGVAVVVCGIMYWVDTTADAREAELSGDRLAKYFGEHEGSHYSAGPRPRQAEPGAEAKPEGAQAAAEVICPACGTAIQLTQAHLSCPGCQAVHHVSCWYQSGGCSAQDCGQRAGKAGPRPPGK